MDERSSRGFGAPQGWSALVRAWCAKSNFADRAYLAFFLAISILMIFRSDRVPNLAALLTVNVVSVIVIVLLTFGANRRPAWRFLHDWYPLAMPIVTFEEVARLSLLFRSQWQDFHLLRLECHVFSVPPTVWLGRHGSPLVTELVEAGYFSYFVLLMMVAGHFYARRQMRAFRQVMDASVLSYLLCYVVFLLFPTEGPAHTLAHQHNFALPGGGPFHWAVLLVQKQAGVHGNAFPSAHVAGAAVAVIFAWIYARKLGVVLTPFVILLCIGAVYDRYHYASDVFAGLIAGGVAVVVFVLRRDRHAHSGRSSDEDA